MADSNKNGPATKVKKQGATRHCCYGLCKNDSRYFDMEFMNGVTWIPFPKPGRTYEKCERWVRACGRENFTTDRVKKWTYICSKHFVGGCGPTIEHPDPIPAMYTPEQVEKFGRKRKAPTPRTQPVTKKMLFEASEALLSLQQTPIKDSQMCTPLEPCPLMESITNTPNMCSPQLNEVPIQTDDKQEKTASHSNSSSVETQTTFTCNEVVATKIERIIQSNAAKTSIKAKTVRTFSYESLSNNEKLFKFYTGITVQQFNHLFTCLGGAVDKLIYWKGKQTSTKVRNKQKYEKKLCPRNQLLLTLTKLRHAFPNKDLAYRFGVSQSTVSVIVNTWIQFLYKSTDGIRKRMFPSKQLIKENLPAAFKSFKNVRIIIDCFEIFIQSSSDFAEQGNMYSAYKNHATLKCLVGIAPCGGISFMSDLYEGSISDKSIFVKSGLLDLLEPGDLVIADRGFLIKDVLMARKVDLNIPPFLMNRERLTAQEEIQTKRIARVRIHVERAIERMKKFRIIGTNLPLSLKPVASQIVQIVGFLVNYQEPLVK